IASVRGVGGGSQLGEDSGHGGEFLSGREAKEFAVAGSSLPTPNKYAPSSASSAADIANLSGTARTVGETNASIVPAIIRTGTVPSTSMVASRPAIASESFRGSSPGNSKPCAILSPAPPARKIAGNSNAPWGATKLHRLRLIPARAHAVPITPMRSPLK